MPRQALFSKVATTAKKYMKKGTLRRIDREGEPFRLESNSLQGAHTS